MITFDIVRVNKSNYINRYYINIAFSYTKKIIHHYSNKTNINNKKTALTKQSKLGKGGHPQSGEFLAIYRIDSIFTSLKNYHTHII